MAIKTFWQQFIYVDFDLLDSVLFGFILGKRLASPRLASPRQAQPRRLMRRKAFRYAIWTRTICRLAAYSVGEREGEKECERGSVDSAIYGK